MGLRSDFPKIDKANYPSIDPKMIPPLATHLREMGVGLGRRLRYVEPTAGGGHFIMLVGQLAECVAAYDIEPRVYGVQQCDVMDVRIGDADLFMGNPPWNPRKLLHDIIVHLSDQAPTVLLFDARWAYTKQAKPFLSRCRKIVTVGRLSWIIENPMPGKDDCAFYFFDKPIPGSRPTLYEYDWEPEPISQVRMCFDCRRAIGNSDKWTLQFRNGIQTPVHRFCDAPTSRHAPGSEPLESAPLLDLMTAPRTSCGSCAHLGVPIHTGVGYCTETAVWRRPDDEFSCSRRRSA